jgi:hypothetical protein
MPFSYLPLSWSWSSLRGALCRTVAIKELICRLNNETKQKNNNNDKVENGIEGFCAFPQNDNSPPVILRGA